MKIIEWIRQNNVHESFIKNGKAVIAVSTTEDNFDTIVIDQNSGNQVRMKKIEDINTEVDTSQVRIFVIGIDQWKKMTNKNLFMSSIRQSNKVEEPTTDGEM